MIKMFPNKHCLCIVGDADTLDGDVYAKACAERNFKKLNSLFGIIDSECDKMDSKEGSWYLQNILFNIQRRLGITKISKDIFLNTMSNMWELSQLQEK